jgi:hypothetical protein
MKRKKLIIILIIAIIFISISILATIFILNRKNEPKVVKLGSENFEEYFILDVDIEDFNVERGRGLYAWYQGTATLKAKARLKKDVQVDGVVIKGRVITSGLCWASKVYNFTLELDKNGEAEYSKQITTGEAGMLYPEEPGFGTYLYEANENEFLVKNAAYIEVSGSIIE